MRMGACQGDSGAQNETGYFYAMGRGFPKDNAQAYYWCALSARQGDENGVWSIKGRATHLMSPEELLEGHRLLCKGAPSGITDVLFLKITKSLYAQIRHMEKLEADARGASSDWAFTDKMQKESYEDALWRFLKTVDDLNPHQVIEIPGVAKARKNGGKKP